MNDLTGLQRLIPAAKWKVWGPLTRRERMLQVVAYCADVLRVHEEGGNNRGKFVDILVQDAGYNPEDNLPWCAILVTACALAAGYRKDFAEIPHAPGAVISWKRFGEARGSLTTSPKRGDLCGWINANGTGHIGMVVRTLPGFVFSAEGNTSSGEAGSQRDGDGVYRRLRLRKTWKFFVHLPD